MVAVIVGDVPKHRRGLVELILAIKAREPGPKGIVHLTQLQPILESLGIAGEKVNQHPTFAESSSVVNSSGHRHNNEIILRRRRCLGPVRVHGLGNPGVTHNTLQGGLYVSNVKVVHLLADGLCFRKYHGKF